MKNEFKLFLEQNNATDIKVWKTGHISAKINEGEYECLWLPDGTPFFTEKDKVDHVWVSFTGHIIALFTGSEHFCLWEPDLKPIFTKRHKIFAIHIFFRGRIVAQFNGRPFSPVSLPDDTLFFTKENQEKSFDASFDKQIFNVSFDEEKNLDVSFMGYIKDSFLKDNRCYSHQDVLNFGGYYCLWGPNGKILTKKHMMEEFSCSVNKDSVFPSQKWKLL